LNTAQIIRKLAAPMGVAVILLLAMYQPLVAQGTAYDWTEKIQLYGHGFKVPTQFTAAQFDTLADMFKIFTVEKRHAYNSYGGNPSTERATAATADSIRSRNPDVKVLLYWNSVMNYSTLYESNIEFNAHPEWVHSIWNTGYEIYDLENIDCQNWWVNSIVQTLRNGDLDGVFLDAGPKVQASGLMDAYNAAVDRVRDSIGPDKIIVYNGYRVNDVNSIQAGQSYSDHQSGVFIEFFLRTPCDNKDEVALLFDNLIEAYNDGKMIIPRATPLHYLEGAANPFLFNFASFLLFYGPNTYYFWNRNGYAVDEGMFDYFPDYYDMATGESVSGPTRNGYVYTREFEKYSIEVDLENVTATITKKETPTPVQKPYGGTAISFPGTIQAENYDLGGEGLAYHDVDAANKLSEYRTDGVDVETTGDTSGDYNVGYIATGEWLEYTVKVTKTDDYVFILRHAGPSTTGTVTLKLDDNIIVQSLDLPATGDYQRWTSTISDTVRLVAGTYVLRLEVESGLFNLNYLTVSEPYEPPVGLAEVSTTKFNSVASSVKIYKLNGTYIGSFENVESVRQLDLGVYIVVNPLTRETSKVLSSKIR